MYGENDMNFITNINTILKDSPLMELLINSIISIPIGFLSGWGLQYFIDKKVENKRKNKQIDDIITAINNGEYINTNLLPNKYFTKNQIVTVKEYNDLQETTLHELRYIFCDLLHFKEKEQYKSIDLYRWQLLEEEDLLLLNKICHLFLRDDFSDKSLYSCTEVYAYLVKIVHSSDGFEIMSFMGWIYESKASTIKKEFQKNKEKYVNQLK